MPYIRKLPSGKWQATVRGPDGKKHTKTDPLQKVVRNWATDEEAKIAKGSWHDPRAGRLAFADWAEKWFAARVVEAETRRGDRGILNNHLLPHWQTWRLNAIGPLDVQSWVRTMQKNGVQPPTIRRAYNTFHTILDDAVTANLLVETPCRKVDLPATPPKLPAWFTRDQVDRIRAELERGSGKRPRPHPGHSVMTELMVCSGPRWGEVAAACGQDRDDGNPVDWLRERIRIVGSLSQTGRWKPYPKTSKSRREIPVPSHVLAEMGRLLAGRPPGSYVFVTDRGAKSLSGANWRVVWYQALDAANERIRQENRGLPEAERVAPIPRLDPHDCRHTAASWLCQAGVPLYDIQKLLGHETIQTTQRYAHLQLDAHAPIEKAWKTVLAHVWRTGPEGVAGSSP